MARDGATASLTPRGKNVFDVVVLGVGEERCSSVVVPRFVDEGGPVGGCVVQTADLLLQG